MKRQEKETIIEEILRNDYNRFYRLAFGYTHDEEDAQDIVQEGAYKAILHSDSLKKPEFAMTWIYRIMLNETFSFCKKKTGQRTEELTEEIIGSCRDVDLNLDLMRAIRNLDEKDKAVVTLRYFEDMKIADIASVLNENVSTIKSRLYRSMDKLKLDLEAE